MRIAGLMIRSLKMLHNTADTKIKTDEILTELIRRNLKCTGVELREVIGHIRRNDLCSPGFILGDTDGYWYSENLDEMKEVYDSIFGRAKRMLQNFTPLRKRIRHLINETESIFEDENASV